MLTYIYLNLDECWLTTSMPQQRFKLYLSRLLLYLLEVQLMHRFVKMCKTIYHSSNESF